MSDKSSELYNDSLEIYLDDCNKISANKNEWLGKIYSFSNLALDGYDFSLWFERSDDVPTMSPLETDGEVNKEKD